MLHLSDDLKQKASKVKLLLCDNDGVLTDGCVYYSQKGEELKRYNMRDGMGIELLKKLVDIKTGIVTKEKTEFSMRRAEKLKLDIIHMGVDNKVEMIHAIVNAEKINLDEVAYIGDDINDLEVLKIVGFAACPKNAMRIVRSEVDYICQYDGGEGAVRDLCEVLIYANES